MVTEEEHLERHLEKESRIHLQLDEDGGDSGRRRWMETSDLICGLSFTGSDSGGWRQVI